MESSPLLLPLLLLLGLLLLTSLEVCSSQPISFNSTIPFKRSFNGQMNTLLFEDKGGGLFIWPLHQDPATSNLSFLSKDTPPMWYHGVSAAYLGYVSNSSGDNPAYVLSVVVTGVQGGARAENGMIVWMANRDNPAKGGDPALAIDLDGHLVLWGGNGELVWCTNATGNRLQLRGDGNLLLYDDRSEVATWQSFDYPGDTLALGQILGQHTRLVSRASTRDLSSSTYSLLMDDDLHFSFYYTQDGNPDSVRYMRTGYQNSVVMPPCITGLMGCAIVDFSMDLSVSSYCDINCSNSRSPYSLLSSPPKLTPLPMATLSNDTTPILRLMYNGDFVIFQCARLSYWTSPQSFFAAEGMTACQLPTRCNRYTTCFPSNNTCSLGCTTDDGESCIIGNDVARPTCQRPHGWKMGIISGRSYISNKYDVPHIVNGTQQCGDLCYQNCSCTASFYDPSQGSCFLMTERLLHLTHNSNSSYVAFIKIASSTTSRGRNPIVLIIIIVITSVASFMVVFFAIATMVFLRRQRSQHSEMRTGEEEHQDLDDDFLQESLHTIIRYSYQEIRSMTNGFATKLGSGGFGSVYEGILSNAQKVAVKKVDGVSMKGSKEFRAEVAIMAGIHHRNLVDLLGFCAEGSCRVLVYAHMSNGSLDRWLFHANNKEEPLLTWAMRFKIAMGVANGLAYLHEGCTKKIIHLDVKPQNILLDNNFDAKVGDFGLSKLLNREESFTVTTMRGTPGYLAPEWLLEGGVTEKIDVYSFGMVLLELVSGRKNYNPHSPEYEKIYFPAWAFDKLKEGKEMELLDPRLAGQFIENVKGQVLEDNGEVFAQFKRIVNVAFLCVQEEPQRRPRMSSAVKMLEGAESIPPLPFDRDIRRFLQSRIGITSSTSMKSMSPSFFSK